MKKNIFFSFVLFLTFGVYAQKHPNDLFEIHYDSNFVNGIGSVNADFTIAVKFTSDNIAPFVGGAITGVKVYINNPTVGNMGVVKIFSAGTSVSPGDLIYVSPPVHVDSNSWNLIPITELVIIPASDLWIGFEAQSGPSGVHSWAGCDAGPNDPDGQYIFFGGTWLKLTALGAAFTYNWNLRTEIETFTQVKPEIIPTAPILRQNYPNPFNPATTINFSFSHDSWVTLKVYNIIGQQISVLYNNRASVGEYSVNFNASGLPGGMYLYKLNATSIDGSTFSSVKKMLLVK